MPPSDHSSHLDYERAESNVHSDATSEANRHELLDEVWRRCLPQSQGLRHSCLHPAAAVAVVWVEVDLAEVEMVQGVLRMEVETADVEMAGGLAVVVVEKARGLADAHRTPIPPMDRSLLAPLDRARHPRRWCLLVRPPCRCRGLLGRHRHAPLRFSLRLCPRPCLCLVRLGLVRPLSLPTPAETNGPMLCRAL